MRILLAPDKFKDCLTAAQVADAMAEGVRRADSSIEIDACPLADGGEGTVEALVRATGGQIETRRVTGPLPRMKVDASIGLLRDPSPEKGDADRSLEQSGKAESANFFSGTAVIEMASASGLHLLKPDQRDPMRTTTYGTSELLREAARLGARRIILGIGGSATVDGGIGVAQACGGRFRLNSGAEYTESGRRLTGGDLINLREITFSVPPEMRDVEILVACDVGNPLLGPDGAAAVFGPQKGASPDQVKQLEGGLQRLVEKTRKPELADRPGAGAAGGLGFGMMAFFNATLRPGIDIVMEILNLRDRLRSADLCLTSEGRFDAQSLHGKAPIGVARLCREMNIPCIVIAGSIGHGLESIHENGITALFAATAGPMTIQDAMRDAPRLIASTSENVARLFRSYPGSQPVHKLSDIG